MTDHIKINDRAPRLQYLGNGAQTVFAYDFPIFAEADLKVYVAGVLQTAGYAVSGAGSSGGGNVTFAAAPANGARIVLLRDLPVQRTTDFLEGGAFHAKTINDELDRQTAFIQQNEAAFARAVAAGALDDLKDSGGNPLSLELPAKAARANRVLAFDAEGRPAASTKTLAELESGAAAAAASAGAAAASATAAENAALAAAASYDAFDDRYLGAKAANPALDNDGAALLAGALYFNTAANEMRVWSGAAWQALPPTPIVPVASGGTGAATAAEARTNLGLGTAATRDAAGGAGALAALDFANAFSTQQNIVATTHHWWNVQRSDTPAGAIVVGGLKGQAKSDAGTLRDVATVQMNLDAIANGAESGSIRLATIQGGGAAAQRALIGAGLVVGSSGADPGAGKVNAAGGYQRAGTDLPIQREFVSTDQTITAGGTLTLAHGLGAAPRAVTAELVCQTGEYGYSAGDVLFVHPGGSSADDNGGPFTLRRTAANLELQYYNSAYVFRIHRRDGTPGNSIPITAANWRLRLRAFA